MNGSDIVVEGPVGLEGEALLEALSRQVLSRLDRLECRLDRIEEKVSAVAESVVGTSERLRQGTETVAAHGERLASLEERVVALAANGHAAQAVRQTDAERRDRARTAAMILSGLIALASLILALTSFGGR